MQLRVLAVLLLGCACKSSGPEATAHGHESAPPHLPLPEVVAPDAVAKVSGPTPLLVFVDQGGKVSLGAGPSWSELATFDPTGKTRPADDLDELRKLIMESQDRGWTPAQTVAVLAGNPPPPPSASAAAEAADDSSENLALQEGRMGKDKPAKPVTEQDVHAEAAGGFGRIVSFGGGDLDPQKRHADVTGEVVDALAPRQPAVLLANPRARASALVGAVAATEGVIGVTRAGSVAPLRIQFLEVRAPDPVKPSTELRLESTKLELGGTAIPLEHGVLDLAAVESAYKAALASSHRDVYVAVDVLVASDVDVQHLVDVLVALEHAGARAIGLGLSSPPGSARAPK